METFLRLFLFYLSGGEASEWKQFGKERKFLFDVKKIHVKVTRKKSVDGTLAG